MLPVPKTPFTRTRLTWLSYWMLGYGAFVMGLTGPLMPFLREERSLSFTLGGVLTATVALGTILCGLTSDTLTNRLGRHRLLWVGATGVAFGTAGLALSPGFTAMLASVLVMGYCCSLTITTVQSSLADSHGAHRSIAITESNVVASLITSLGPLAIGAFQRLGAGWEAALFLPAAGVALLGALFRRVPLPEALAKDAVASGRAAQSRLPLVFWAYWLVVVLVVAIEFCMVVWGADFLETVVGLSKVNAATAMGLFFVAIVAGRLAGALLARRQPATTLLLLALSVTGLGFLLFWLPRLPVLNLAGLFVTGLGVASLFPFTLSVALGLAPAQMNTASARVSLGVGLAIFAAPLALGGAADRLGLPTAYSLVAVLTVLALLMSLMANRLLVEPDQALPPGRQRAATDPAQR